MLARKNLIKAAANKLMDPAIIKGVLNGEDAYVDITDALQHLINEAVKLKRKEAKPKFITHDIHEEPDMTLRAWANLIDDLTRTHGEDAILKADAGPNNVSLALTVRWLC